MPRTAPAESSPTRTSIVRWHDVAGVEEAKAELAEIIEFLRDPGALRAPGRARARAACCCTARRAPARRCWPRRSRPSPAPPSSRSRPRPSSRCSPGLGAVAHPQAVRRRRASTRPRSSSSTSSTPSAPRAQSVGLQPRAGPDAQPAARRARRLPPLRRRDHGLDEPPRHARRRAAAARAASTARSTSRRPTCTRASRSSTCTCATSRSTTRSTSTAIARATAGLTGADLENICNEAAIRADQRRPRRRSRAVDFDDALERVVAGLQDAPHGLGGREARDRLPRGRARAARAHRGARHDHPQGHDRAARRRARLQHVPARRTSACWPRATTSITSIVVLLGRPRRRAGRARRGLERRRRRSRALARPSPARWCSTGASASRSRRARCAPTTSRSRRTRSGSATRSSRASATTPTPRPMRLLQEHREALERLALQAAGARDARPRGRRHDAARRAARGHARVQLAGRAGRGPAAASASGLGRSRCAPRRSSRPRRALRDLGLLGLDRRARLAHARRERAELAARRERAGLDRGRTRPRRTRRARSRARPRACAAAASAAACARLPCPSRGRRTPSP